jgi:regulator of protease activity HflC (stomatin/prohibitin superfamily)
MNKKKKNKENNSYMKKSGLVGGITLGVIILVSLILLMMCTTKVPAGYVGVKYSMSGGVQDDVLTQGWHIISPTVKTTLYTIGIEQSYLTTGNDGDSKEDESFSASSSEGKAIQIDLTFTYQYQAENVVGVFTRFKGQSGKEVRDSFIKPNIVSWTKEVVAKYKVSDILGAERANINLALTEYLASKFEPYGITISNVSLINIDVDDETREAINAKITAQQNAETQAINNQTAIDKAAADAQVKLTEKQAEADALLIEAQASADAVKIQADAESEANKKIAESLTSELIEKIKYEQWDGALPKVEGSSTPIVNIGE